MGDISGVYRARLRLATSFGKRVPFYRHAGDAKLPFAQNLDLVSPALGNLPVPHGHGLSADTKRVGKALVRSAEVIDDLLECGHSGSVSVLPNTVKPLTRGPNMAASRLAYMNRKRAAKDKWSIERGIAMKAARMALGYSQARVAELCGIKDRETVSQYESGKIADIDPSLVPKLSKALGLAVTELSRDPINIRDEGADLRVSPVARQIAYSWDGYPLSLQNTIRHQIVTYENTVKQLGLEGAAALYGNAVKPQLEPSAVVNIRRKPKNR